MNAPNKPLDELTDLQLEILAFLWERGEATASEVHAALEESTKLARKSVGTLLGRLETYGILTHREEGREFVYRPRVSADEVREAQTRRMVRAVFGGSVPELVSYALEAGDVAPGDVERIRDMIEAWERRRRGGES